MILTPIKEDDKPKYYPDIGYIYKINYIEDKRERKFVVLPNGKPLYPTFEQLLRFTDVETAKLLWENGTDYAYETNYKYEEKEGGKDDDEDLEEWFK